MIHDLNQFGLHVKAKATSTLNNMKKSDLIKYIRELEHNYNMTVDFNEQQARNIEAMLKEKMDENRTNMKVYIVMEDSGYEGENDVTILGVFPTPEKAKEKFKEKVYWAKYDFGQFVEDEENDEEEFIADEGWEFEETEINFWAQEITRSSRNWVNICIAEEEVER